MTAATFSARSLFVPAALVAMLAAASAAAQSPPRIIAGTNGEAEVIFNNNCVVYYNARGVETKHQPVCSSSQRERAREAIDAYRREQGLSGGGHGGGQHGGEGGGVPELRTERDGSMRVSFRNGCDVRYNYNGRRTGEDRSCSDGQLRRADDAVERFRREQGLSAGGSSGRPPEIIMEPNGSGRVEFRDGCTVKYNRDGERRDADGRCSTEQKRRADRAMEAHRREQGIGSGSSGGHGGGRGDVSVGADGNTEVRMSGRCLVRYSRDGVRLEVGRDCEPNQLKNADAMEVKFRMSRLNQQGQGN